MTFSTALSERLGCATPIIQAPMAGGGDTPDLIAAVCEAGGFGFLGAAYLQPEQIFDMCRSIRGRTKRPFGINLFAPSSIVKPRDVKLALARVAPYFSEMGLPPPAAPDMPHPDFDAQLTAVLKSDASAFSFTFGKLPAAALRTLKANAMFVMGTATTVEEAITLARDDVDAIIAQGSEAGGHRGTFAPPFEAGMVGTMALLPQVVDAVDVPVIASGGIMDGRGIAAALALGAMGVQLGTVFLTCDEAGIPDAYKNAILSAHDDDTRITHAFSGRPARGIRNRFMEEVGADPDAILPFPWQNAMTRPLRSAASKAGQTQFLSLWAGQGVRLARRQPAKELMRRLDEECNEVLKQFSRVNRDGNNVTVSD